MADNLAGTGEALDVSLPTVLGGFLLLRESTGMLRKFATPMKLGRHQGSSVSILNLNRATAVTLTNGVDLTMGHILADTLTQYTPNEVGVKCMIPHTTRDRISEPNLEGKIAKLLNDAYGFQEDADLADEFVNFTTALGAAADVLSPGHIAAGVARVQMGNTRRVDSTSTRPEPPGTPIRTVLHPFHGLTVVGRMIPYTDVPTGTTAYGANTGAHAGETVGVGNSAAGLELLRGGPKAIDRIGGEPVYINPNINVDASDDASSATFAEEGLIFVEEMAPTPWKEVDASARVTEIGLVGRYVPGTYRPGVNGVEYLADASIPTS